MKGWVVADLERIDQAWTTHGWRWSTHLLGPGSWRRVHPKVLVRALRAQAREQLRWARWWRRECARWRETWMTEAPSRYVSCSREALELRRLAVRLAQEGVPTWVS